MCEIGTSVLYNLYSLLVLLPHPSCVRVCLPARLCPAYLWLMQMLWTRLCACLGAYMRVRAGVCACDSGVPLWGAAALRQRYNRLQKFLSKIKDPLESPRRALFLIIGVSIPRSRYTQLREPCRRV